MFLIPGGFALAVVACAGAAFLPADWQIYAMAAAVGAYALWSRSALAGLATGVMAWFFTTGFLVNGAGELSFGGADLLRLGILMAPGLLGLWNIVHRRVVEGPVAGVPSVPGPHLLPSRITVRLEPR